MKRLTDVSWEDFSSLPLEEKAPYLSRGDGDVTPYHTLFAQQFEG